MQIPVRWPYRASRPAEVLDPDGSLGATAVAGNDRGAVVGPASEPWGTNRIVIWAP